MSKSPLKLAPPKWATPVLLLAGAYNILWGAWVVLFPLTAFRLFGLAEPTYPELWQCIGMIVGVYGVGYIAAALDPVRHWPIILVGFLGKIFGPIGFISALIKGTFPPAFGIMILFNDLIWWLPFGYLLYFSWKTAIQDLDHPFVKSGKKPSLSKVLQKFKTQHQTSLSELSHQTPVLLIFLRHAGCTFCREAMSDLSKQRDRIEASGIQPVLVDMMESDQEARRVYQPYRLADLPRIHDPKRILYRSMGLKRGRLLQLFGLKTWYRGIQAGLINGHGIGWLKGDGLQMPGVFLIENDKIISGYKHKSAADRPDFEEMACEVG